MKKYVSKMRGTSHNNALCVIAPQGMLHKRGTVSGHAMFTVKPINRY